MKRLKIKVFFVLFGILSFSLVSILIIFNYQGYQDEETKIRDSLNRMKIPNDEKKFDDKEMDFNDKKELSRNIFLDLDVYTVLIGDELEVINHTGSNKNDSDVLEYAKNIIKVNSTNRIYIGNLYFAKYSYSFDNHSLIIIDNHQVQIRLSNLCKASIILFLFIELGIILLSLALTKWIIKPVIASFNKQKQFVADASHELKTPLAVIMANAEALENDFTEKKWLNNILEESNRMNHLITDLLDLARLEEQGIQNYSDIHLTKELEKSILTFESLIYERNLKLDYHIDKNIMFIGNLEQLKQLFAILLDNAIEHSSKNGKIEINLEKKKKDIYLEFRNSGEGIPKGQEEKIFERFYKTDESRNRDSNHYGLGLAIAKEIVERHHGSISACSSMGETIFKIKFKNQ